MVDTGLMRKNEFKDLYKVFKNKYKIIMAKKKNFLILAILLGLAGITIGSITIFSMLSELKIFN